LLTSSSEAHVANSIFVGNQSFGAGVINNISFSYLGIYNCLLNGNGLMLPENELGYAVDNDSYTVLYNCTISNNSGVGVLNSGLGTIELHNCILWNNQRGFPSVLGNQFTSFGDIAALNYNSIEGWDGSLGGEGNVDLPPMFVDADGPDDIIGTLDDNLRLSPQSPLINAGDPTPLAPYLDGDGHARILCDRIDIGAYEFGIGDFDCDREFDLQDIRYLWVCLTGPDGFFDTACAPFDFHAEVDDHVDLIDFSKLQTAIPADWP
jgi:hypothetical protein